jgi:predicted pyridoxine 5'-phosphate oxidase superfamily flavin-nucleotide-binding protein
MGQTYDRLDEKLIAFIGRQKMFFVATAPLSADGSVNLSPKGYDTFAIIDPTTVAWLDLGGSGIETMAHLRENGRITLMFCAFEGRPNILRLYGRGEAIAFDQPGYAALKALFPRYAKARSIVRVRLTRIADSCGWGVPLYDFTGERDQLARHIDHIASEEWSRSRYERNATSIDGLPGMVRSD